MMEKWIIDDKSETSKEVRATARSDPALEENWPSFERDVTSNPFYHPKPKRIAKLEGYPFTVYRYRKNILRVVYYPDNPSRTVFPLEVAASQDVSYKKRSSRRAKIKKPA
jgi:mRNA-degrading endonuclease RelE of RelBE toxin-antitoxin system